MLSSIISYLNHCKYLFISVVKTKTVSLCTCVHGQCIVITVKNLPERISTKIRVENDHWMWTASSNNGYGKSSEKVDGKWKGVYAHRQVYQLLIGPIPSEMTCDHLCDYKLCVNPSHIELVTLQENVRRGIEKTRKLNERLQNARVYQT